MPRLAVKVQGAQNSTRWTLAQKNARPYSPVVVDDTMPTNGHYYNHHAPAGYDDYDESGYGSPESSRASSTQWKQPAVVNGHYDDFDFNTPLEERASHQISVNTRIRSHNGDVVGQHLLYETALLDTEDYEILDIGAVDALKKEHARLISRIDAANRKLTLESKVKDAAQNLQRLYSTKKDNRPDTPQSPDSPKRVRTSLLGGRGRNGSSGSAVTQPFNQAEDEVAQSIKKVDELNETIKGLMERRQVVERQLMRHTAAVLADQAQRVKEPVDSVMTNGHRDVHDSTGAYEPSEFDSIRDILHGKPAGASKGFNREEVEKIQAEYDQHLQSMQDRLEHLNVQLRGVISEASQIRGTRPPPPEMDDDEPTSDTTTNVQNALSKLERSMLALESEQHDGRTHQQNLEERLGQVNAQLYQSLPPDAKRDLAVPPRMTGQGHEPQVQYLDQASAALQNIAPQIQRAAEHETVMSGLWDMISTDALSPRGSVEDGAGSRGPPSPLKQDFSIQAFSSRVQALHSAHTSAKEQQDILRRQIQQQRDLNGKSDMEKDRVISEWQGKHNDLLKSHEIMQEDLAKAMFDQQQSEKDANESRGHLDGVMNEFEQLKQTMGTRMQELETHRTNAANYQKQVEDLSQHQTETEHMESEIVRLTTELTIAKAELESAYGTRAERQKEAGERTAALERELQAMTNEFQDLTKESLELEKERSNLESLIDGLRDRVDSLEAQLADEKVRLIGAQSPRPDGTVAAAKETTSVAVLRQEFKKMLRESRAEGVKLIRAEQEERRRLEAEMRKARQANGPLGRANDRAAGVTGPQAPYSNTASPAAPYS